MPVSCGNKIEFSFGTNYASFCSDSHIYKNQWSPNFSIFNGHNINIYAHMFNKVYIANDLTVLRHIMGYVQNVSTEVPEGSKLCNTFGTNERVH